MCSSFAISELFRLLTAHRTWTFRQYNRLSSQEGQMCVKQNKYEVRDGGGWWAVHLHYDSVQI